MRLLIATNNPDKVAEFYRLLDLPGLELVTPLAAGLPAGFDVEETGTTFEDNAILKATQYARAASMPALADDSGLEVSALNGQPGVYSKRFAGPEATDAGRNNFLLQKLAALPEAPREARFVAALALVATDGRVLAVERGVVQGHIIFEPRGSDGFGYDPLFALPEAGGLTMAELSGSQKDQYSHRGRAVRQIKPALVLMLQTSAGL